MLQATSLEMLAQQLLVPSEKKLYGVGGWISQGLVWSMAYASLVPCRAVAGPDDFNIASRVLDGVGISWCPCCPTMTRTQKGPWW